MYKSSSRDHEGHKYKDACFSSGKEEKEKSLNYKLNNNGN